MSVAARPTSSSHRTKRLLLWVCLCTVVLLVVSLVVWWIISRQKPVDNSGVNLQKATQASPQDTATSKQYIDNQLQNIVTAWTAHQPVQTAVVAQELTGKLRGASSNSKTSLVPASTYKIYVAYAVLHAIEQGTYNLNTALSDGNTVQTDLNAMILNSDNTAARSLGFLVGWQNINVLLKTQGASHTNLYNYIPPNTQPVGQKYTTANDLAIILTKLQKNQLLNTEHTNLLLSLMRRQRYRERIPAGLPGGVVVADKPGWLTVAEGDGIDVQNDAAIVYGPKSTYVLVVLTKSSAAGPLTDLSHQVYNYLEH